MTAGYPAEVLLATDVDFWHANLGNRNRILTLFNFLTAHFKTRAIYLGVRKPSDEPALEKLGLIEAVDFLIPAGLELDQHRVRELFRRRLAGNRPQAIIFEYLWLYFLLPEVPARTLTLLDAHDLMFARAEAFRNFGREHYLQIDQATELAVYDRFDKVIMIQDQERDFAVRRLGRDRVVLAPHPAVLNRVQPRQEAARLGFLAGGGMMNRDGLTWFLNLVWPLLTDRKLTLDVYGTICQAIEPPNIPGVRLAGPVADPGQAYAQMDIAVNPVLYGAGLKIKNVEALGRGLPLVTTSVGAAGLGPADGQAFVAADDPTAFAAAIERLVDDREYRLTMAEKAYRLAEERFSSQACFAELKAAIEQGRN